MGFFYLVGHNIPVGTREQLFATTKQFFALPQSEKESISMEHSKHFVGIQHPRKRALVASQITVNRLIGEELPALQVNQDDPIWFNLHGPNQWPQSLPD
ncbi:2-oxoglutarate and iron-dependent oxygenase domain-containing protein [Providencia hangzhouensis]|uniref:2-oxoglutarate and iron-dependent oxygenase domain-containing protein n=1 Tax=Providencia hangzhouensis TaxID=3031799 RepID=UPI0034DD772C